VSRERGVSLQLALARYLQRWWPNAESAGSGRNGRDVTGTPGVWFECKTASDFKRDFKPTTWMRQARAGTGGDDGDLPVVVYFPKGIGAESAGRTLAIMPLHVLMRVLTEAQYAPLPASISENGENLP
jgi:hypothetical protein